MYGIKFSSQATRFIGRLDEKMKNRIKKKFEVLEEEPFRFLIDLAVISAIEKGLMEKRDFIRTEKYNLRLRPSGARKLMKEILLQFNKKVKHRGREYTWSYVLVTQTLDLAHYLVGKKDGLNFCFPAPDLNRADTAELRKKILTTSIYRWQKKGFSKGTLSNLKKNARSSKPLSVNRGVLEKLEEIKR